MYLVTKASDDYYAHIEECKDLTIAQVYKKYGVVILSENDFYGDKADIIMESFECDEDKAKKISQCKYIIEIYDDYVE